MGAAVPIDELEERFLAELRDRVAWPAAQAARIRAEGAPVATRIDVLEMATLRAIVDANGGRPRAREWRSFLTELEVLADTSGRLPGQLERLVRVVLADLLP